MIPKKSGDKVKTDPRDSRMLARLHRAGELDAIYVPTRDDEAIRDLIRCREDAVHARTKARQRLVSFLWRHGHRYPGKSRWGFMHLQWISRIKFPHVGLDLALQEYLNTIEEGNARVERLTQPITDLIPSWRFFPVVRALMAFRGVKLIVASTLLAELGNLNRFSSPKQLAGFIGVVSSEYSSGSYLRQGAITKSGNPHARRVLIEAAWAYRHRPRTSEVIVRRQKGLPQEVKQLAWKARSASVSNIATSIRLRANPKMWSSWLWPAN